MGIQGICVLLVNEDLTCCNIVAEMLKKCTYEVLHFGKPLDTLSTICERKDSINLVLTNLHRIQAQGTSDILHHIQKTLNLPTFLMSPDDKKIELKEQDGGFAAYLINSYNNSDVSSLWELASVDATEVTKAIGHSSSAPVASSPRNLVTNDHSRENTDSSPSPGDQFSEKHQGKRKSRQQRERCHEDGEASSGYHHDNPPYLEKRPRVIWTDELHKKFLEAMEIILPEKPVPKKIVEMMNIPWLRRENVASHLQKYRLILKKAEERANSTASDIGMNILRNLDVGQLSFPSFRSGLDFNSRPHGSSYLSTHLSYGSGMSLYQRGHLGLKSIAAPRNLLSSMSARVPSRWSNWRTSSLLAGNNHGSMLQLYNSNLTSSNQSQMSQKNNYLPLWNSRGINGHTGLQQMQLNLGTGNLQVMNNGFGVHGDQTKSHDHLGSSSMSDSNRIESSLKSYVGVRLSSDGKSIEFGQPIASGNKAIRLELPSSNISGSENQSLDHLHPSTSTNTIQVPPSTLQQNGSSQNHNLDDNNSFFERMSLFVKSLEDTVPEDPRTAKQHHPLPQDSSTTVNEEELHGPSRLLNDILPPQQQSSRTQFQFGTPASWGLSVQSAPLPASGEQQPSLLPSSPPRNGHSVQYLTTPLNSLLDGHQIPAPPPPGNNMVGHYSAMLSSQQENIVPFAQNPGHDASIQETSSSCQKVVHQESSISLVPEELHSSWLAENFWNETGGPPLWDGNFDDTFFN